MDTHFVEAPSTVTRIASQYEGSLPIMVNKRNVKSWGILKTNDHILFAGDSITDAFRKPEEINIAYQLGSGFALMIAARLMAEHPEASFHFSNLGVSGQSVTQLAEQCDAENIDPEPSVVSILIGVNSTLKKFKKIKDQEPLEDADFEKFSHVYAGVLQQLTARHPSVRFVLCEPFLLPCGTISTAMVEDIRNRAGFVRQLSREHEAVFVPFQSVFDAAMKKAPAAHWAYDGIHPTAAGFWLLAETWLNHVVRCG